MFSPELPIRLDEDLWSLHYTLTSLSAQPASSPSPSLLLILSKYLKPQALNLSLSAEFQPSAVSQFIHRCVYMCMCVCMGVCTHIYPRRHKIVRVHWKSQILFIALRQTKLPFIEK